MMYRGNRAIYSQNYFLAMISYCLLLRFYKIEKKVCIRAIRNYINTLQQLALNSCTMTANTVVQKKGLC